MKIELKDIEVKLGKFSLNIENLVFSELGCHAVVGHNGAGKTTLLKVITGQVKPLSGLVRFGGQDVTRYPVYKRARCGLESVFQFPRLPVQFRVGEVIGQFRGQGNASDGPWDDWLDKLHREYSESRFEELSFGHRKLLMLALGLSRSSKIVLFDEPAAGMGNIDLEEIIRWIRCASLDRGIVMVEHRESLLENLTLSKTEISRGRLLR